MDNEQLKHEWPRLRVLVQKRWPRLTDDDLVAIDGDHEYLIEALVARYNYDEPQAEREWRTFAGGVGNGHDSVLGELRYSAQASFGPGATKIREGFQELGAGLRAFASDARVASVEKVVVTKESAQMTAEQQLDHLRETASSALEKAELFVRERPFAALGIAFVAGWLVLGRR